MDAVVIDVATGAVTRRPLTADEIAERGAEEEARSRDPKTHEHALGPGPWSNRWFRDLAIAALPKGHVLREKSEQIEAAVDALGVRK